MLKMFSGCVWKQFDHIFFCHPSPFFFCKYMNIHLKWGGGGEHVLTATVFAVIPSILWPQDQSKRKKEGPVQRQEETSAIVHTMHLTVSCRFAKSLFSSILKRAEFYVSEQLFNVLNLQNILEVFLRDLKYQNILEVFLTDLKYMLCVFILAFSVHFDFSEDKIAQVNVSQDD